MPGCFILLGAIGSGEIEEQLILVGSGDKVLAVGERFDFIELLLHKVMDGLDIGLESVLSGRNGAMNLSLDALDGVGEGGVIPGLPGADKLGTIIALPGGGREIDTALLQVLDDALGKDGGVSEAQFIGVAQEQQSRSDIACGVLVLGEVQALQGLPVFGDITEVFGIDVDLLAEVPLFFHLPQQSLGLRLLASP